MVLEKISSLIRGPSLAGGGAFPAANLLATMTLSCCKPCAIAFRGSILPRETCVSVQWRGWLPFRDRAAALAEPTARARAATVTRPRFRLRIGAGSGFARVIPPHPYEILPRL